MEARPPIIHNVNLSLRNGHIDVATVETLMPVRFEHGPVFDLRTLADDEVVTAVPPHGWQVWRKTGKMEKTSEQNTR